MSQIVNIIIYIMVTTMSCERGEENKHYKPDLMRFENYNGN